MAFAGPFRSTTTRAFRASPIPALSPSPISSGGRLDKIPWRLSDTRKANVRKRLRMVDSVIEAVRMSGVKCHALTEALKLPTEAEMPAKDKYFVFSRKHKGYRKGIHKVPHWTKITSRTNPEGF